MGELGNILELMHGAGGRFESVRAVVREWRHRALAERAIERYDEQLRRRGDTARVLVSRRRGGAAPPPTRTTITRVWWQKPDRVRLEHADPEEAWFEVAAGERWWSYGPRRGAVSNDGHPELRSTAQETPFPQLFEPALVIPTLDLEPIGPATHAGRPALRLRASEREVDHRSAPVLPWGADAHELLVDAERGVLLRLVSFIEGEQFALSELEQVAFDEQHPPETFVFRPPPGVEVRPWSRPHIPLRSRLGARLSRWRTVW